MSKWKQVGGGSGSFHKWDTPGQEIEGVWRGQHDGKYGPVGTVETERGTVRFALHTALLDRVARIREGAEILIRYVGKQESKQGRTFKAFDVFIANAEDEIPPEAAGDDVPF